MAGKYGKGCIPSEDHKVGLGHPSHLLGAALPSSASVPLPPPVDQGQSSSCTGNSSAVAICAAMSRAKGLPEGEFVELPSRLFLYFGARALEGNTGADDGAQIADIFDAASKLGVPPESAWTFSDDLAKITANPDWMSYTRAADQRVLQGAWRIRSIGSQRVRDVRAAIAGGNAVVLGTLLDQAFEDMGPSDVWPGVSGEVIGGHAIVACGFRTNAQGGTEFQLQNSWSAAWCDGGKCWISSDAVASSNCSDLWLVQTVQAYSEAA